MKTAITFLLGCLLCAATCFPARSIDEIHSYHNGKRYTLRITGEMQAKCPRWNPEADANPPVSAAKALAEAKKFIAGVEKPEDEWWELENLALEPVSGRWIWRARYLLRRDGVSIGVPTMMDCCILMDGTRVEPIITDSKK